MDLRLKGKKVLVTGSTAGIGFAIGRMMLLEGAHVVLNGRTQSRVDAAVDSLRSVGEVSGVVADVSTREGIERLIAAVLKVDILINNLGVYEAKSFTETSDEDWDRMLEVNLLSGARLSRHFLPLMKNKGWGRIIFISSETGVNVPPDMIAYGTVKAAQIALARGLAETTAGTNVTVNSVLPGPTRSEGISNFLTQVLGESPGPAAERQFLKELRPTSLIQRFAEPEEVASLVAYLASPLSSATNGAALRVEGGLIRSSL